MTYKLCWSINFQAIDDQCWSVTIADNHLPYVHNIDDIHVNALVNRESTIKLKNVLYVPKFCKNLILIGRLTECRVAIIHVRNLRKVISNYSEGNIIMTGQNISRAMAS